MVPTMHIFQPVRVHVGINLSCADIGMPQKFLHHAQIRPAGEQVRGKRVSEFVGMNMLKSRRPGNAV